MIKFMTHRSRETDNMLVPISDNQPVLHLMINLYYMAEKFVFKLSLNN